MGHRWLMEVPEPLYVETEAEAYKLLHLLLQKMALYPTEPIAYDTETNGLKVPIKKCWDERGKYLEGAPFAPSDPLDWMSDTVEFWSLSAQVDRDLAPFMQEYVAEYHPEQKPEKYARWCIDGSMLYIFSPLLENPDVILATWNGKYDGHVTYNSGIDIWQSQVLDLLIAGHLLDENLQGRLGLKDRAEAWCGLHGIKYTDLFDKDKEGNKAKEFETNLHNLPLDKVVHYSSYDAYLTLKVYEYLIDELKKIPIEQGYTMWDHFINVEVPFTRVLWRMERRGLRLDIKNLEEVKPVVQKEIDKLAKDLCRVMGGPVNLNSPPQLVAYFFGDPSTTPNALGLKPVKMTQRGGHNPSTDEEVLEVLSENGVEAAKLILRYRKVDKIQSTYVRAMLAMSKHHKDGNIHPNFNQYGARTGRLSTNAPNSQNFWKAEVLKLRELLEHPKGQYATA